MPLAVLGSETLPQGAVGHETLHLTPALLESLVTVAVTGVDVPAGTDVPFVRDSEIIMLEMVTGTLAVTAGLVSDLAAMVTVRSAGGTLAGAV